MSLRLTDVTVAVPGSTRALVRDLSLAVATGRVLVVVGPNGSGKTTLLRTLAGLLPPFAGNITLDARPLVQWPVRERAREVAYLPAVTPMTHDLSVAEVVALGRVPWQSPWRGPSAADGRAIDAALERLEVAALRARRVSTLSGGERQRVMLARMLATEARHLVLDEPTAALDIGHALDVLACLRTLAQGGHAVVLALHDLDLALRYGDDALCLPGRDGTWAAGTVDEVLEPERLSRAFGCRIARDGAGLRAFGLTD